jgi:hypothetical protein
MAKFVTGIEPSLPLAVYMRKQEKCQTFAQDAGVPISGATMVTTGKKAALNCGGMELAWREWKCCPLVNHMWNNWKLHWTVALAETRDINRMIANDSAFANKAATDAKQAAMMAKSLDNLANAPIQKNDTVEKLITANAKLAKALADANAAIARLHLPDPPHPPNPLATPARSSMNNCCPSHWSTVKPDWDPTGYCSTHGFKVKCEHSSATCTHQRDGHNTAATRSDPKGGSKANNNRTPDT